MKFTEEDVPLMKLIFNPSTHDMGMLVGGERAKEIVEYVCNEIECDKKYHIDDASIFYHYILTIEVICNFFWDNSILNLSLLDGWDIYKTLTVSPIKEKIWDSGKLNISLLSKYELDYFKQKFESQ